MYDPFTGVFTHRFSHGRAIAGDVVGWVDENGYRRTKYQGKTYVLSRLAWLYMSGEMPNEIDHRDGNPSNNEFVNLRNCTRSQNLANAKTYLSASGTKGVHPSSNPSKWRAIIRHQRRTLFLGNYDTVEEAKQVYQKAADAIYGSFAFHNRPTAERN